MLTRRVFLAAPLAAAAQPHTLELSIEEQGRPVPCRVRVRDAAGKDHVPEGALVVRLAKDEWFASNGTARLNVPPGAVTIRVERGPEYVPFKETVTVQGPTSRRIPLRRWIHMADRGYSSGEDHLHIAARQAPEVLAAEGLDFAGALDWWNGPRLEIPPGATSFHAEVENAWSASYLIGLNKPMDLAVNDGRAHLAYLKAARGQGALLCCHAGWWREVLFDALLGYIDVVEVCNNLFHRHKFAPRKNYSNLLAVDGFPEYPNTPAGMLQLNLDSYYRLLNCGLKLAAGAGSATGVKTTPAGYNRAYVRAGSKPGLKQFLDAWRQGRNFVTNGPMVFLKVEGKHEPGDTIAISRSGSSVRIEARAMSDQPLRSLEIVANGGVIGRTASDKLSVSVRIRESAWIVARATENDQFLTDEELGAYRRDAGKGLGGEEPCRLRFGHTSPVYASVGNAPVRVEASVDQAVRMLDAFERFAQKQADPQYRDEVLGLLPEARSKLRS